MFTCSLKRRIDSLPAASPIGMKRGATRSMLTVPAALFLAAFSSQSIVASSSLIPNPLLPPEQQACRLGINARTPSLSHESAPDGSTGPGSGLFAPAPERSLSAREPASRQTVHWQAVLLQSARFLAIQHGVRVATQEKTRAQLRGPYFQDYWRSVRGLTGWHDGDSWKTNYVGHPMQGSISGYIFTHNDPRGAYQPFSRNPEYWKSRLRAMAFNAAYSTHYELSPIGEAGIGNVGMKPGTKGAVDLVITPTLGAAWMITEDMLDAKVIAPFERSVRNPVARLMMRSLLNPTRSFANLLRGSYPWHRDTRGGVR